METNYFVVEVYPKEVVLAKNLTLNQAEREVEFYEKYTSHALAIYQDTDDFAIVERMKDEGQL